MVWYKHIPKCCRSKLNWQSAWWFQCVWSHITLIERVLYQLRVPKWSNAWNINIKFNITVHSIISYTNNGTWKGLSPLWTVATQPPLHLAHRSGKIAAILTSTVISGVALPSCMEISWYCFNSKSCPSSKLDHIHTELQGGAPQVLSWFIMPLSIDISTKSLVIRVITQLSYLGGTTSYLPPTDLMPNPPAPAPPSTSLAAWSSPPSPSPASPWPSARRRPQRARRRRARCARTAGRAAAAAHCSTSRSPGFGEIFSREDRWKNMEETK